MIQSHRWCSIWARLVFLMCFLSLTLSLSFSEATWAADDFVIFGEEGVWIKRDSVVVSGDVGANSASTGPFLNEGVEVSLEANVRMESSTTRVFGNRVSLMNHTQVFGVQTNALSENGTVHGQVITPLDLPVITTFPQDPKITTTTLTVEVPALTTHVLDEWSYDKLIVRSGATLILSGGLYEFSEMKLENNVRLVIEASTELRVVGRMMVGSLVHIGPAEESSLTAADLLIVVAGINGSSGSLTDFPKAVTVGSGANVQANVSVPNGTLEVQRNSSVVGALLGKWVMVGEQTSVTLQGGFGLTIRKENETFIATSEHEQAQVGGAAGSSATIDAPSRQLSASTRYGLAPLTVSFRQDLPFVFPMYRWEFGDGQTSAEATPTHVYDKAGVYQSRLIVTRQNHPNVTIEGPRIMVYPERGSLLLSEPFTGPDLSEWDVVDEGAWQGPSQWQVVTEGLTQTSNIWSPPADPATLPQLGTYLLYRGGMNWKDYRVSFIMSSADDDVLGVMIRFQDSTNYYRFSWDQERGYRRLVSQVDGVFRLLAEESIPYEIGKDYHVTIQTGGNLLEVRIDGHVIFGGALQVPNLSKGSVALYSWYNNGARFRDLTVEGNEALPTTTGLAGSQEKRAKDISDVPDGKQPCPSCPKEEPLTPDSDEQEGGES